MDWNLTPEEQQLVDCAARGTVCEFEKKATIRAGVIAALMTGENPNWTLHRKGLTLANAVIFGTLNLENVRLASLCLDHCEITHGIVLRGATLSFLYLVGCRIEGVFRADYANAQGMIRLKNSIFLASVEFSHLRLDGDFDCSGIRVENNSDIRLNNSIIRGNMFMEDGFFVSGKVSLMDTKIEANLVCKKIEFINELYAQQLDVGGALFVEEIKGGCGRLDLRFAQAPRLYTDQTWNSFSKVDVDGFRYGSLVNYDSQGASGLCWLERSLSDNYAPQPYEQLAKVLKEAGHDADAREVLVAKERHRLRSGGVGWKAKAWGWVTGQLSDHGYRPWKVLYFMAFVWFLGVWFFGAANWAGVMTPSKERVYMDDDYKTASHIPAAYPAFNAWVYSADVLLPIVDLHQESYWMPSMRNVGREGFISPLTSEEGVSYIKSWLWIEILLGWFLTSFLVAGVTGLIKRD